MAKVFVTGANGFVGVALCRYLTSQGHHVQAGCRQPSLSRLKRMCPDLHAVVTGSLGPETDWRSQLSGIDVVIHLAARVHVMKERAADPLSEFRLVNTVGTKRLARDAVKAGVLRLVYVSTIKVNGEFTENSAFNETDLAAPADPYAISKHEAEMGLQTIARETGLEVVIVRPALVYGPGVKGNFGSLIRLVDLGVPLPLRRCSNRRSLIGLGNFVDLLSLCATHPASGGEIFLAADGEDLPTPELVRRLASALSKPARLLPIPVVWLKFAARLMGRLAVYERLCGSLQIDGNKARRVLGWIPPRTVDEELAETVAWYRGASKRPPATGSDSRAGV